MDQMTTVYQEAMLAHSLGISSYNRPPNIFLAFLTADPTDAGTQTSEIAGSTREQLDFDAPAARGTANTSQIDIDTTGWTDTLPITHVAIANTASAGDYLMYGPVTETSISFTAGVTPIQIAAGALVLTIDSATTATDEMVNLWINHSLRFGDGGAAWTMPTALTQVLHTAAPSTADGTGFEFTGGGYAPQTITFANVDAPAGSTTRRRNDLATQFTDIQSTPLRWWSIRESAPGNNGLYLRDQGSDSAVTPGSTIDYPINRCEIISD